jgi:hypothetical protein
MRCSLLFSTERSQVGSDESVNSIASGLSYQVLGAMNVAEALDWRPWHRLVVCVPSSAVVLALPASSQGRDVLQHAARSHCADLRCQREGVLAGMMDVEALELAVCEGERASSVSRMGLWCA